MMDLYYFAFHLPTVTDPSPLAYAAHFNAMRVSVRPSVNRRLYVGICATKIHLTCVKH